MAYGRDARRGTGGGDREAEETERTALTVYRLLGTHGRIPAGEVSGVTGLDEEQASRALGRLRELGLLRELNGDLAVVEADTALAMTMDGYDANLIEHARSVSTLRELTHTLMSVYRPAVAREVARTGVEVVRDRREREQILADWAIATTETSDAMHPGPMPPPEVLQASLARDALMAGRGVRLRYLYPRSVADDSGLAQYLDDLADLGAEVRFLEEAPFDVLIFDRLAALCPMDPAVPAEAMCVVTGSSLVEAYSVMFEDFWLYAIPYRQVVADDVRSALTPQQTAIFRLLALGLSDDQIARKVGLHRRTVQAVIAKSLDALGLGNRFEAGVKLASAAELGFPAAPRNRGGGVG